MWHFIYKLENFIERLLGNNTEWERTIYKFLTNQEKIPTCGHYDRYEQCCNDYNYCGDDTGLCFCESTCPHGVNGEIRLPLSKLIQDIIIKINKLRKY